ncbi:MAG: RIP metalloprotease RseP [Planctomycetota bacterium]|nr:RIP metalloprotease RseP [Planctomycetota bacterium]
MVDSQLMSLAFLGGIPGADSLIGFLGVVVGFSSLIFVHEMGHFLLAKWNGVRVHVFSIGMGPYVFSFTKGETLYVLSLVPIGGYVKMAGQDDMRADLPCTNDPRDYRNKSPGQRAAILAAGAIFNLVFAIFLFTIAYYRGVEMTTPRVGDVLPGSPLANAQAYGPDGQLVASPLKKGDRILAVDGESVKSYMEVTMAVAGAGPGNPVWIDYARHGHPERDPVQIVTVPSRRLGAATIGMEQFLTEEVVNLGYESRGRLIVLAEPDPASAAGRAGVKAGDFLSRIDGVEIADGKSIIEAVQAARGAVQKLEVSRQGELLEFDLQAEQKEGRWLLGIAMGTPVTRIDPESEAYAEGLREGCVVDEVRKLRDGRNVELTYFDPAQPEPRKTVIRIPMETRGDRSMETILSFEETEILKGDTLLEAVGMAWDDLARHSTAVFTILRGLLTGNVSPKSLSSFVGIAHVTAKVSVESSFMKYLWFIAFISVNLGVLQFVPIPLLDGWHLLLIGVEKLKGGPVAPRIQEAFTYVGLVLILLLLVFATGNDLYRMFGG